MTATVLDFPRPPKRSIEVSPADLESIAFDAGRDAVSRGLRPPAIERPEGAGWRRLTVDGVRYHAWQNAAEMRA